MTETSRRAVFLDRDGVLNELVRRDGAPVSPRRLEDFRLREGASEAVRRLRGCGLLVFVVTNQPDIARGGLAPEHLARMSEIIEQELNIDEVVTCPHDDGDRCTCRKPAPGMLLELATRWNVALDASFMVGDSWRDVEAGRRAGCRTILVDRARQAGEADVVVGSLAEAVEVIERTQGGGWRQ